MLSDKIYYTDEMLSGLFNRPLPTVRMALQTFQAFEMIEIMNQSYYVINWEKHQNVESLDKVREQTRLRVNKHRQKMLEGNANCNVTVTQDNAIELDKELDKEKEYIYMQTEELWSMYPNKKGKATAIKKIPKLIKEYSYESIKVCIERYVQEIELKKTEPQYIKHGSTFFNTGYADYLDENYVAVKGNKKIDVKTTAKIINEVDPVYKDWE